MWNGPRRGPVGRVVTCDESETLGINNPRATGDAERHFQTRARASALEDGVTLTAPETVFFALAPISAAMR